MSVTNGGTVSLAGGGLAIGANSGANGSVSVQGGGSALKTTGSGGILVGQSGNGTLTVGSGGTMSAMQNALDIGANMMATVRSRSQAAEYRIVDGTLRG